MDIVLAALIAFLGSGSFQVREAASQALAQLDGMAEVHIELATHSRDPEVAWRAERLASKYRLTWLDQVLEQTAPVPWIDALPWSYPNRDSIVTSYLGVPCPSQEVGPYPQYRTATRAWLQQEICGGMSRQEIVRILKVMAERCKHWQRHGQFPPD
jgi:hypothetical protein